MPIFGLVWVASWVSCFFSSTQDFLKAPTYLPNLSRFHGLSSASDSSKRSSLLLAQAQFSSEAFIHPASVVTVSSKLKPSGTSMRSQLAFDQAPRPLGLLDVLENLLSPFESQSVDGSAQFARQTSLHSLNFIASGSKVAISSNREENPWSLQTLLFRSSQRVIAYASPVLSQVVVVRAKPSTSSSKDIAVPTKGRGFWRCAVSPLGKAASTDSNSFQIWVRGCLVAEMPSEGRASAIARQWQQILQSPGLKTSEIQPMTVKGLPGGKVGDRLLFTVDPKLADRLGRDSQRLAIEWVNHLRVALGENPLTLAQSQAGLYDLVETREKISGLASWYGPYFHGRLTATGEIFNQDELTAAHPSLPFGTYLKVTNLNNDRAVIVRINDRGPYFEDRMLDLSREAARCLHGEGSGVIPIEAVVMQPAPTNQPKSSDQRLAARL